MRGSTELLVVITNREISSRELLDDALDELVDSARDNGLDDDEIVEALHARAARAGDGADGAARTEEGSDPDVADGVTGPEEVGDPNDTQR